MDEAPDRPEGRSPGDSTADALKPGEPLPTLPLWLSQDLGVSLALEESYEQACADLWMSEIRAKRTDTGS